MTTTRERARAYMHDTCKEPGNGDDFKRIDHCPDCENVLTALLEAVERETRTEALERIQAIIDDEWRSLPFGPGKSALAACERRIRALAPAREGLTEMAARVGDLPTGPLAADAPAREGE